MKQPILKMAAVTLVVALAGAAAGAKEAAVPDSVVDQIRSWASDPVVVGAVKEQNTKHAAIDQAEIDKLDKQWRAETKASAKPLITTVLDNSLSGFLKKVQADAAGLYTEIFVMDNKGLNVGQSDVTSDYWQGDEAKWQKTYKAGNGAVFVDEVEFDESTQTYQSQVSVAISDPATNTVIGAVTVGINMEKVGN